MKRIISAFFFLLLSTAFSARAGEEPKDEKASREAVVIKSNQGCGYMLQLSDGKLIQPVNFPKKFQKLNEHVLVVMDGMDKVNNSPCDILKEGYIVEISFSKPDQHIAGK